MSENQNPEFVPQPLSNQPQPATTVQTKTSYTLVVVALVFGFLIFGIGGYYLGKQSNNSYNQIVQSPTPTSTEKTDVYNTETISPTSQPQDVSVTPTPQTESDWQSYTNSAALYKVEYPKAWRVVSFSSGEGYGPMEVQEDVLWAINIYDKNTHPISKIASDVGSQFSDKKQSQDTIIVNGLSATKITTTTPSIPDWYSETIVIERGSSYIAISNGAISNEALQKIKGVPAGTTFERFYNSFVFVN